MLDRQAKARNPNAPRTHSPRKPMAIRPRRVAILSDCIAFIPIQRRPDAFERNLTVAEIFHRTSRIAHRRSEQTSVQRWASLVA
jgi:hypothetical protein